MLSYFSISRARALSFSFSLSLSLSLSHTHTLSLLISLSIQIKAIFRGGMAEMKILHNPFTAYTEKHKNLHEPEPISPLQDLFEYVRPPG